MAASNNSSFLVAQRLCIMARRFVKDRFRPSLVAITGAGKTYDERLKGLPRYGNPAIKEGEIVKWEYSESKDNLSKRNEILNQISSDWIYDHGSSDAVRIADHYNVFSDLFGHSFFYPQFNWKVVFNAGEEKSIANFGNKISAESCLKQPNVDLSVPADSSNWCLVMTALDGHLSDSNREYVLWMVANLQSGSGVIDKGDVVVPYIPPFPPRGLGFCRVAIVLYKQNGKLESPQGLFSTDITSNVKSRDFSSSDWYKQHQDALTPASLRFFQTKWDDSVTGIFHDLLEMKEPVFEYDTPQPHREEQMVRPPEDVPFQEYLDNYRDQKDINEEIFGYYLYNAHNPVGPRKPPSKYPNLKRHDPRRVVSWIRDEETKKRLRQGKWKNLPEDY